MKNRIFIALSFLLLINLASFGQDKKRVLGFDIMTYKAKGLSEEIVAKANEYFNMKKASLSCIYVLNDEERTKVASDAGYFMNWDANQRTASGMVDNLKVDGYLTSAILNAIEGKVTISLAYQLKGETLNYWTEEASITAEDIQKAIDALFLNVCK